MYSKECIIFCNDIEVMYYFLNYVQKKKLIKNILVFNDKNKPYHVRIKLNTGKKIFNNIIKKKFNNYLTVRY